MTDEIILLPDGRKLAYVIYGSATGQPVLYFHGTPSSRLEPTIVNVYGTDLNSLLDKYNIKLISIDRPGMGLSTFNAKGSFISFANDVEYLKTHLNIGQCKVLCWSGGGPFALAMAYQYPEQVKGTYIIAGFTLRFEGDVYKKMHANKLYFGACKNLPTITRWVINIVVRRKFKKTVSRKITGLPDVDHNLISEIAKLTHVSQVTLQEACRQGCKGAVYEGAMYFKSFGFALSGIKQPVHFWWGDKDSAVIRYHSEAIGHEVVKNRLYYKPGEGHLSIYVKYFEEVLENLVTT